MISLLAICGLILKYLIDVILWTVSNFIGLVVGLVALWIGISVSAAGWLDILWAFNYFIGPILAIIVFIVIGIILLLTCWIWIPLFLVLAFIGGLIFAIPVLGWLIVLVVYIVVGAIAVSIIAALITFGVIAWGTSYAWALAYAAGVVWAAILWFIGLFIGAIIGLIWAIIMIIVIGALWCLGIAFIPCFYCLTVVLLLSICLAIAAAIAIAIGITLAVSCANLLCLSFSMIAILA
jgi:hypothetical protein